MPPRLSQAPSLSRRLVAAVFLILASSAPALARTTVDAGAKRGLIVSGLIGFLGFAAVGGMLFLPGWRLARRGAATPGWATVEGQVISAEVLEKTGVYDGDPYQYFQPKISYAYVVNGKSFTGDTIKFGLELIHYPSTDKAREWLAPYPIGAAPLVHYDPADPQNSALELGQHRGGRWLLFGAFFWLLALGAAWFAISIALTPVE